MEKISQELLNELSSVPIGITNGECRGIQVIAYRLDKKYGTWPDGTPIEPNKLKNVTFLDVISKICDSNYYFDCKKRALKQYYKDIKLDPNAELKPKNGALAAFPFKDYRQRIQEDGNVTNFAYSMHLGTQLFDGDFDLKSGKVTYDQAKALSKTIISKLYPRLCKYKWFIIDCESTSAKGVHIYTHSNKPEFDCYYSEDGVKGKWEGQISKEDYYKYCIKYFTLNYQIKLYYILKELKPIWDELNLEEVQPLESFFDTAMYKVTQPFNITPMHTGNIMINPNFKNVVDMELFKCVKDNNIEDIRDIKEFDEVIIELVKNNLNLLEWHAVDNDYEFEVRTNIKAKDYDLSKSFNKEGFYFGHSTRHTTKVNTEEGDIYVDTPLIKEVIHTMKCFYDDSEIEQIWKTDGFYNQDAEEANVISWIKNWKEYNDKNELIPKEKYVPKRSVVEFLNKWCGFNIRYEDYTITLNGKDIVNINMKDDEYLGDYWGNIIKAIDNRNGIYLVISPTGSGKTATHTNNNKKLHDDIFNYYMQKPVIITEPYNSILMSKFNDETIDIITGSKRFPSELSSQSMYATNYVHFMKLEVEDIKLFKYIIIDESHLLTKEEFRSKQLIEFINKIRELSENSIVILQTATPMDEYVAFKINGTFNLIKEDKRNISYTYVKFEKQENEKFSIYWCYDLIKSKLDEGIKTYVYCNNIEINKAKILASLFENDYKVALYHKRILMKNEYSGSAMEQITNDHALGEYDLLISSVYFGVGNDLNDNIDKACCIVIGNNPWQEDVQVFGRFRNAKNIDVICVLTEDIDDTKYNYNKLLHYAEKNALWNFRDMTKRKNSNVIWSKLENEDEARMYAIIKINEQYHSSKYIKDTMLPKYVKEYDEEVHLIKPDLSKVEYIKNRYKEIKDERLKSKIEIIEKLIEDKNCNTIEYRQENKFDSWINTIKRLRHNIPDDVFMSVSSKLTGFNNIHTIGLFNRILRQLYDNELDYAEIAAFEHYRKSERNSNDLIHSFLIWYFYCNFDDPNDYIIESNWWFDFKWKCKNYAAIPECLIDYMFNDAKMFKHTTEIDELHTLEEFFGKDTLKNEIEKVKNSVIEYDPNGKITGYKKSKMTLQELTDWIDKYDKKLQAQKEKEQNKQVSDKRKQIGQNGGKKTKSIVICEEFKHKEKYGLKAGQIFMSCNDLAKFTGKSVQTVSTWMSKKWIVELI